MSEGTNLAKAYVQIVPSAQGIKSALGEMLGNEIGEPSKKAGSKAGSNIVGMIKKAVAAAGIGVAIKKVVGEALSEGAAMQQSIGGIETLFGAGGANSVQEYARSVGKSVTEVQDTYDSLKASEEKMLAFADNAWKTAGLSANDYMETSTSFAASLLSSLDGDTNAAAEAANKAVIAMADNANKMGTDMQSIQNAYQGFAKQNYTMLDNLKLGYGGTKTEMERLLADAEKLSGVHYDIDNLADVYNAVSVIQDKLGITGTTAKEAASTFSGSMASMKATAQNVLGKMALGEDIGPALQALGESVKTFVTGNLVPMLFNVLYALPGLADQMLGMFMKLIDRLPGLLRRGTEAAMHILTGLMEQLPTLFADVLPAVNTVVLALARTAPGLISAFTGMLPELISSFTTFLPLLLDSGMQLLTAVADGIIQALPTLTAQLPVLITSLLTFVTENLPTIIETGVQILLALIDGLVQAIPALATAIPQIVQSVVTLIMTNLPTIITAGIQILTALINGIIAALPQLIVMIPNILQSLRVAILENLGVLIEGGVHILTAIVDGILSRIGTLIKAGIELVSTIWEQLKAAPKKMLTVGADVVKGIWSGISGSFTWIKNKLSEWIGNITDFIKKLFKIGSPSKLMADEIGKFLPAGIAVGVDANATLVDDAFQDMAGKIDAEASFSPVLQRVLRTDGFGFTDMPGADAEPMRENVRSEELLEQILEILAQLLALYRGTPENTDGVLETLIAYLDQRFGRISAMKARGV
jgi:phage-related protein